MWQEKDNSLYREFIFKDFNQAFSFMQSVALEADKLKHHPRWENDYNRVQIWLNTHEEQTTITNRDRTLAAKIDDIYKQHEINQIDDKITTQLTEIKLYTDGGSRGNPGPSASGFVILDEAGKVLIQRGVYLGVTTNNQAEYQALKLGLQEAQKMQPKLVSVYMDSLLIVNQMLGKFKVKNNDLRPIYNTVSELIKTFSQVTFTHVPRELNKLADAMVNEALDKELKV